MIQTGVTHTENQVYSTLRDLSFETKESLISSGKFWLTTSWAAAHLFGTLVAVPTVAISAFFVATLVEELTGT